MGKTKHAVLAELAYAAVSSTAPLWVRLPRSALRLGVFSLCPLTMGKTINAVVAQLVERLPEEQGVVGSNPARRTVDKSSQNLQSTMRGKMA